MRIETWYLLQPFVGFDDDLRTTTTINLIEKLLEGEQVFVRVTNEGDNHGAPNLLSDTFYPSVIFSGHKISSH